MKKTILSLVVAIFVVFSVCARAVPLSWNTGKDMNILCVLKYSNKVNFFVVKYSSSLNIIKVCFVDENIHVQSNLKKKKLKSLKEIFFETEESKQISTIKFEIEKIFNNKIKFDYYVLFDDMFLNKITEIFLPEKISSEKENLLNIIYSDEDRYNVSLAEIKIINGIYGNINRWKIINMLKKFYSKEFVFKTNFRLKDVLLSYAKILDENKVLKYADIPVTAKKDILRVDMFGMDRIIKFLSDNNTYIDKNLKIEVLNTTGKSRLAIKAANRLRQNNFDVFDWGSSSQKYLFTIIFDFVDTYTNSVEIKKILNCGEIIFKPEERNYTDISVQLGNDCIIYDKLDRDNN